MLDMNLYRQMGFSDAQVNKAHQISKQRKIDIFDALQLIQKQPASDNSSFFENSKGKSDIRQSKNIHSVGFPLKKIDLSKYQVVHSKKASRMSSTFKRIDLREQKSPVGLLNVYNCCYLNSLLQCYFLSSNFMKYIFQAQPLPSLKQLQNKAGPVKIKRIQNEYNLLYTLKDIFGRMCLTSKKYIDPTEVLRNLVDSVGQKVQFGDQKDLFQMNIQIIERLNQCLLYTKKYYRQDSQKQIESYKKKIQLSSLSSMDSLRSTIINKSKVQQRDNIKRLFYGQKVQYTEPLKKEDQIEQIVSDFLGIIINPAHENLYKAIDEQFHYEVEIEVQGQNKTKKLNKHTYIKQIPEYMYFYINRTGYNAQQKQALKIEEKLSFDFVIYLDRYLESNKQEASVNAPAIKELHKKKNELKKTQQNFQIFAKRLQQCRQHAAQLNGWAQKLPKQSQIDEQMKAQSKQIQKIQKQLQRIQSRKQKYYLMYIFAHRGDAVSGHYWGYGRNHSNWYRFDINTKIINQDQILLDLYKSGGTPYALVYVKKSQLPQVDYKYYNSFADLKIQSNSLIEMYQSKKIKQKNSYFKYIPQGIKKVIISENIKLHQELNKKKYYDITLKTYQQYTTRISLIESQLKNDEEQQDNKSLFSNLPIYQNFPLYLWTINQHELAKFNIFAVSLKIASNLSTQQMIKNQTLLTMIQKLFRKKLKGNKILKHFCIYCEPKEKEKYNELYEDYLIEKQMLQTLQKTTLLILKEGQISKKKQNKQDLQQYKKQTKKILQTIALFRNKYENNNSYIKFILNQLISVFLIKIVNAKIQIQLTQKQLNLLASQMLKKQLTILGNNQSFTILPQSSSKSQNQIVKNNADNQIQRVWKIEEIVMGTNKSILEKKLKSAFSELATEIKIFKKLEKSKQFSKINSKGQVSPYKDQQIESKDEKQQQQQEDLI